MHHWVGGGVRGERTARGRLVIHFFVARSKAFVEPLWEVEVELGWQKWGSNAEEGELNSPKRPLSSTQLCVQATAPTQSHSFGIHAATSCTRLCRDCASVNACLYQVTRAGNNSTTLMHNLERQNLRWFCGERKTVPRVMSLQLCPPQWQVLWHASEASAALIKGVALTFLVTCTTLVYAALNELPYVGDVG
ncbi:hypothetical protein TcWFU_002470 [Taenia crassiceps]|uniref:Uncharacterized protein n=1 Tax=Taenia crassiceps TaxID=6207 RepID=A0ABR4Q3Y8_9CEST